jgi:hypothetical protein
MAQRSLASMAVFSTQYCSDMTAHMHVLTHTHTHTHTCTRAHAQVGPARPVLLDGEALDPLIQRLKGYMIGFDATPWTAQRLAELLLEPGKQYKQLHKLVRPILTRLFARVTLHDMT